MGEIDIGETIKNNIDYWKNLYFEEREKRNDTEEKLKIAVAMLTKGTYPEENEGDNDFEKQFISKDKIKEKIEKFRCETTWGYNEQKYDEKIYYAEHKIIDMLERELLEEK